MDEQYGEIQPGERVIGQWIVHAVKVARRDNRPESILCTGRDRTLAPGFGT